MLAFLQQLQQLSRLWRRRKPVVLELPAGTAVNKRYEILCQLGGTLYDRTYLAEDWWYSGWCVLTEFAPRIRNAQELALAREQVQATVNGLQQLDHPQIPQFREVFECQVAGITRWVVVQEWIEGLKYSDLVQSQPFEEAEVVAFLQDALPALDYLHRQTPPMLHRNLKPSTLIQSRENGKPALITFGDIKEIAVLISRPNPKHKVQPLDRRFQPPEYDQGDFYPSGDLYSLAVTALTLLTGCPDPARLYDKRQQRWRWSQYAGVSIGLAVILERMLQADPELRYPSAKAVMAALTALTKKKRVPTPKQPLLLAGSGDPDGSAGFGRGRFGAAPGVTITVEAIKQTGEAIRNTGQGLVQGVRSSYTSVQTGWGKLRAIALGQLLHRGLRFGFGFGVVGFVLLTGYVGLRAWQVLQARPGLGLSRSQAGPSEAGLPAVTQPSPQPQEVYGAGESKLVNPRAIAACGMDLEQRYGQAGSKNWQEVDRRFSLAFPGAESPLSRRDPEYDFYLQEWCYLANAWLEEWGH